MQLYDHLIQFPLFQGMSRDNLAQVGGHTKFGFLKCAAGQTVVSEDDPCVSLYFLLSGSLRVETRSDDRSYGRSDRKSERSDSSSDGSTYRSAYGSADRSSDRRTH